ncbi:MAG: DUF3817 domain-containing protein [Spirochaetaceae bacterium]|nr:DUF3817 domain-containing protein [Spirochaetaceae bacterium]
MPTRQGSGAATASTGEVTRFRVMAWTTGLVLSVGALIGLRFWPWYIGEGIARWFWTAHGWLYLAYLVTAFTLAYRLRWSIGKTVLVLLAGTVPFMSFVAERRVSAELARRQDLPPGQDRTGAPSSTA